MNRAVGSGTSEATYRWILAWVVMLVALSVFNRTRMGHVIIYYSLALSLLLVFATQYQWFTWALAPLGSRAPGADVTTAQ